MKDWTRRTLLAGSAMLVGAAPVDALDAIEARHGGRLGLFALDTGSGRTLSHRADERFVMCSSVKCMLAACVLARVDAGREDLGRRIAYRASDCPGWAPVTRAHAVEGAMTVSALCAAAVEVSDNGAANVLLRSVGGPGRLTAFYRSLGDTVTRSDRFELALNERNGDLDTTTPRAFAGSMREVMTGRTLSLASRARLNGWMAACQSGRARLRAALPAGWSAGDKTGTADGFCNDVAVAWPPGRAPIVIAAYHDAPGSTTERQEAALREAGAAVVRWAG